MPNAFDTTDWDWNRSEYSVHALGDSGPWVWWLPLLWRAISDPQPGRPYPPRPEALGSDHRSALAYRVAWWTPLLHLSFFAMGWPHPERGIPAALELADADPRLDVLRGWWGQDCEQILGWFQRSKNYSSMVSDVSSRLGLGPLSMSSDQRYSAVRTTAEYEAVWTGGSDPLHLGHAMSPVSDEPDSYAYQVVTDLRERKCTLLLQTYAGWYSVLNHVGNQLEPVLGHPSWRVDVIVRPVGWLGTYRKSSVSNRWFSGPHRWHQLGFA